MTDEQAKTPAPGAPEPTPPTEQTEPALEPAQPGEGEDDASTHEQED